MSERSEYVSPSSKAPAELGEDTPAENDREPLKICLVLDQRTVEYLDRIGTQSRGLINRSMAVRAIVTAFLKRGIRFTGARTESDLDGMVGRCLDYYLSSRASAKTDPKPAAPAPRPQATGGANHVGAGNNGRTAVPTTVPPPGDQDDESRPAARASDFDFDAYMESMGCMPRPGYRPQRNTASAAGDRATVETVNSRGQR
jgi:hypothetical protein